MKIKVFTAFSGYDSQCLALDQLSSDFPAFSYELVGWSEIDKNAIKAHDILFPQYADLNYGDISKIDWNKMPYFDLFTYSSPCQDFSLAGRLAGGVEGSGTRSSLLWECRKAIEIIRPKYLLLENVENLVSKKFFNVFSKWIKELEEYGYTSTWKVINARDFGIPQNRRRVFLFSILNAEKEYEFPDPVKLEKTIFDLMDPDASSFRLEESRRSQIEKSLVHLEDGRIWIRQNTKTGWIECCDGGCFDSSYPKSKTRRGRVQGGGFISPTLTCHSEGALLLINKEGEMRRLTPAECFRLMGCNEKSVQKLIRSDISNAALYKLSGNSIVVNVLYNIWKAEFVERSVNRKQFAQLKLF